MRPGREDGDRAENTAPAEPDHSGGDRDRGREPVEAAHARVSTLDPALPLIAVISSRLHAEGPGERHPARDPIEFGLPAADERACREVLQNLGQSVFRSPRRG